MRDGETLFEEKLEVKRRDETASDLYKTIRAIKEQLSKKKTIKLQLKLLPIICSRKNDTQMQNKKIKCSSKSKANKNHSSN